MKFKLPKEISSCLVKTGTTCTIVEDMLKSLNLSLGVKGINGPHGILSKKRRKVNLLEYLHQPHEYLNIISNLESWDEVPKILHPSINSSLK